MKRTPIDLKRIRIDRQAMQCRYPAVADASDEIRAWLIEWAKKFQDDCDNSCDLSIKSECLAKIDCIRELLGIKPDEFLRMMKNKHEVNQE